MPKIVIDTGSVVFDIEDAKGRILGQLEFIPTDSDIIRRYKEVVEKFNSMKIGENPTEDDILSFSDTVKEQVNYLLNYDVSASIFSICGPLTVVTSGDFFFENVMDAVATAIESVMKQRVEKKMEKVRRATAKYHK